MSHCSAAVSMSPATLYPVSRLSWVSSWSAPLHPDSVSHISVVVTSFLVMSLSAPSAICPHLSPRKTAPQCTIWDCNSSSWWLRKNTSLSFCSLCFVPHVSRVLNVDTGPGCQEINSVGFLRWQGGSQSYSDGCRAVFLALFWWILISARAFQQSSLKQQ